MVIELELPAALEEFARACVADGRYSDVGEVMKSALLMMQSEDQGRAAFVRSLDDAVAEADRDGWLSSDLVRAELLAEIDARRERSQVR